MAIKLGVGEAKKWNGSCVKLFSDCQEAIEAIAGKEDFWCWGGYTLNAIGNELRSMKDCTFTHIARDSNGVAHLLAKLANAPTGLPDWINIKVKEWVQELW